MFADAINRSDLVDLARDPLVRLVMASDGVTEADFVTVLRTAQRAVEARWAASRLGEPSPRRARPDGRTTRRGLRLAGG